MNYCAEVNFEKAKAAASLNDPESMRDLFNAATSKFYLERTAMTFDELDARGFYANSEYLDWARDCTGEEWDSIEDCIECAGMAADDAVETERLTAAEVIARAGIEAEKTYIHTDTGAVASGQDWMDTIRGLDPDLDSAFDPNGDGAHLVEVEAEA